MNLLIYVYVGSKLYSVNYYNVIGANLTGYTSPVNFTLC